MHAVRINVTTDGDGDGNDIVSLPGSGPLLLYAVEWIKGDYENGVDAVLSCVNTLSGVDRTLLTLTDANSNALYYPRTLEDDETGGALTTHTLPIVDGDLKLVVDDGGDTATGGCVVHLVEA